MQNRAKLIRETPDLIEQFKDARYHAAIILVDADEDVCIAQVRERFDENVKSEFDRQRVDRFLILAVAQRNLEHWFLADQTAIQTLLPRAQYNPPADTSTLPRRLLHDLWRQQYGTSAAFNKPAFAGQVGPKFTPETSRSRSRSFDYFWNFLEQWIAST
jgi:hypothetical protein